MRHRVDVLRVALARLRELGGRRKQLLRVRVRVLEERKRDESIVIKETCSLEDKKTPPKSRNVNQPWRQKNGGRRKVGVANDICPINRENGTAIDYMTQSKLMHLLIMRMPRWQNCTPVGCAALRCCQICRESVTGGWDGMGFLSLLLAEHVLSSGNYSSQRW